MVKRIYSIIPLALLSLILITACSTVPPKFDDAVRIKPDKAKKYESFKTDDKIISRNGNVLRGKVLNVTEETRVNCETFDTLKTYYVYFLDSLAFSDMAYLERIPLEDVVLLGKEVTNIPSNEYGNINWFENYSNPLNTKNIREVPVEKIFIGCEKNNDCGCKNTSLPSFELPEISIRCPNCQYSWYFVEAKLGYAVYSDKISTNQTIGRDSYFGELVAGLRFNSWGIGLAYNNGIKAYNQFTGEDITRSFLLLHARYTFLPEKDKNSNKSILSFLNTFAEKTCIRPFVYGQFGIGLDKASIDLFKVKTCSDCESKITYKPGNIDLSLPLSYGLGAGFDVPIPGCLFDLSFDLGYRNYDIGETLVTEQFKNVPSRRSLEMFVLRLGLTFGY